MKLATLSYLSSTTIGLWILRISFCLCLVLHIVAFIAQCIDKRPRAWEIIVGMILMLIIYTAGYFVCCFFGIF
jgi:membrane-anchored glycerophosphoryl diester phosphodiesterase (GDPDase)